MTRGASGLRGRRHVLVAALLALTVAGCDSGSSAPARGSGVASGAGTTTSGGGPVASTSGPAPSSSGTTPTTRSPSSSAPAATSAETVLRGMTLREEIGQLLMVDCPTTEVADATVTAIQRYHVGSVILDGTSTAGLDATRAVTRRLAGLAPPGVGLFISTDQEGGIVQRLQGPGFTAIPSAVAQGQVAPSVLRSRTRVWAGQLRAAGVNVDLAPVLDTVPAGSGPNPPIGDLDREYGSTPSAVAAHGLAVARALADAGVDATVKHFPGLGRVSGNTDLTSGVRDTVTTRDDPYLAPFRAAVAAGVPFVMISTAIYTRIDPTQPAAFSSTVITGMLRQDLGFQGVVISDDVGAAAQVRYLSPGQRAVAFVAAGGDVVLTVDASQAAQMSAALLARASTDRSFRAQVDAAALRVLQAKQARGLLS